MTQSFDYEAIILGLTNVDLDPNGEMNVWLSSSENHQWNPQQKIPETAWEAEIDRLMRTQASSRDPKRRKEAFDRVQEIVVEQEPFIFLINKNSLSAVSTSVRRRSSDFVSANILERRTAHCGYEIRSIAFSRIYTDPRTKTTKAKSECHPYRKTRFCSRRASPYDTQKSSPFCANCKCKFSTARSWDSSDKAAPARARWPWRFSASSTRNGPSRRHHQV